MDPKTVELIAAEAAALVQGGWTLFNGQWTHPTRPGLRYDREVAVGIQRVREKAGAVQRATAAKGRTIPRFPGLPSTTPPPMPATSTPTTPEGVEEVLDDRARDPRRDPRRE